MSVDFCSHRALPVGAVSYMDIDGYSYKRDVLFCYDLKLPESFVPENEGKPFKNVLRIYCDYVNLDQPF